jgi:DNA-binding CsgD family transcriptional regulator
LIVGRDAELDELRGFIRSIPSGFRVLVVEGRAGVGKTTLWQEGLAFARERGYRVLAARAAQAEARLSYSALGDLLAGELGEAELAALPSPQRLALSTALLLTEGDVSSHDQRSVATATLGGLRSLALTDPVLVAVDDVQWLDSSSARVLAYALRRLSLEPVGLLVSLRVGTDSGDVLGLDRLEPGAARLRPGPLPVDALGRLLRAEVDGEIPRPVLSRIHRTSNGNPLFALEIARAVARERVRPVPGAPLPVPEDLQQLLAARIVALPAAVRRPLLTVAAASQPTVDLVLAVAGQDGGVRQGLASAEAAGVIEGVGGRLRFSHPLLGSTVYVNASARDRREVHRRLAVAADDPEERARHLALASDGPDADVARALDEAARHLRTRGAPDAAADLAELAVGLTPPADADDRRRRWLAAADYHIDAGDAERARELLVEAIESSPPGRDRARILYRLSSTSWMNLVRGVREPAEQALDEAGDDVELRVGIHQTLAWVAFYLGDLDDAQAHAGPEVGTEHAVLSPAIRGDALATQAFVEFLRGRDAQSLIAEAVELEDVMLADGTWTEGSVYTLPRSILSLQLMWAGRLDEARSLLEAELAAFEERGLYTVRQEPLCYLAELECRAGRWQLAGEYADEAMETITESGQATTQTHVVRFAQALAAAYLGRVDEARRLATEGCAVGEANGDPFYGGWNRAVLGFLDLSLSRYAEAHAQLEPVVRFLRRMGSAEPAIIPCVPDDIEALVALGDVEAALPLLDELRAQGQSRDRAWALLAAARGQAQVSALRGDLVDAETSLAEAVERFGPSVAPFERARSLLVLGQVQRRRKRKQPARDSLDQARQSFAALGAPLWVARADTELSRIGGRPPAPLELTATERQVAELVAEGRTNHEVAAELFMSLSSVQSHLKRVFGKLGVRSRTELAAAIARGRGGQ